MMIKTDDQSVVRMIEQHREELGFEGKDADNPKKRQGYIYQTFVLGAKTLTQRDFLFQALDEKIALAQFQTKINEHLN